MTDERQTVALFSDEKSKSFYTEIIKIFNTVGYDVNIIDDIDNNILNINNNIALIYFTDIKDDGIDRDEIEKIKYIKLINPTIPLFLLVLNQSLQPDVKIIYEQLGNIIQDIIYWPNGFSCNYLNSILKNAQLLTKMLEKEEEYKLLIDLVTTINSELDFYSILFSILSKLAPYIKVDRCSIILIPPGSDTGYVLASSDNYALKNLPIELNNYPEIGMVFKTKKYLILKDPINDPIFASLPKDKLERLPNYSALFPIFRKKDIIGILFIKIINNNNQMSEKQLEFCQFVANATSNAIFNTWQLDGLREQTKKIDFAKLEAERKLRLFSKYVSFFENSADSMVVVDTKGRILFANTELCSLTGLHHEALREKRLWEIFDRSDKEIINNLLKEFKIDHYPRYIDLHLLSADGFTRILSLCSSPLPDDKDAVLLTMRDVSEERVISHELKHTKEFLEKLIINSSAGIFAMDIEERIILFNPSAEKITGYKIEEVLWEKVIDLFYSITLFKDLLSKLNSDKYGGRGILEPIKTYILTKSGESVLVSLSGGVIYNEDESPIAYFGIFTDLRPILTIEQQLEEVRSQLIETEKKAAIATIAGTTAHELNQPLTSVMAYIELIQREMKNCNNEKIEKGLNVLISETKRMAEIVKKIAELSTKHEFKVKNYVGSSEIIDLELDKDNKK